MRRRIFNGKYTYTILSNCEGGGCNRKWLQCGDNQKWKVCLHHQQEPAAIHCHKRRRPAGQGSPCKCYGRRLAK